MVKHRLRESIKSLFGSHIDPEKEKQLQGAKTEIEDKVKRILKLIRDENLEEDGAPVEFSKKGPLVKLIEDFHSQYQSLYERYDHLTGELRKKIKSRREKGSSSSSSDSDSDYSAKDRDSKNGQLEGEFQKIIDGIKQELEMARAEAAELNGELKSTYEEKGDLHSKYLEALSKIQEADKINLDIKTDAETLGIQRSKLLVDNDELNKQLDVAGKMEAELNQRLGDMKREIDSLKWEKQTAFQQIGEEQKITNSLRTVFDQLKDEKSAIMKELEAVTGEHFILKQQLEHAEQQVASINHTLKVTEEENESFKSKFSQVSNEAHLAQVRIEELVAESILLKDKLDEREREVSALTQMREVHEGYKNEASNSIRALEAQVSNLELELESLRTQNRDMEVQIKSSRTETKEITGCNIGLRDQISELEMKYKEREHELSALMKKLEDNENESSSKIADLTSQMNNLLTDIGMLRSQKDKLEEQIVVKGNEASTQVKSTMDQVNVLQQEMESLEHQKSDLEVELEKKVQENSEYVIQIQTLKEEVMSKTLDQQRSIEETENLTVQIRNLELEVNTIKNQKSEVKEQIMAKNHEISQLREEKLGPEDQIAELEKRSAERESEFSIFQDKFNTVETEGSAQITALRVQINNLQHDLVSLQHEKEELAQQCKRLKLEVDSLRNQKNEIDEQIRAQKHENSQVREEISGLQGKITTLQKTLTEKDVELSAIQDKVHEEENEALAQKIAFAAQVDKLQKDLFSLQKEKEELALHCEGIKEEHVENQITAENEKNELASKIIDHQRMLEEQKDGYEKLNEQYKQMECWFQECKGKLEVAEKKIEKMKVKFHKGVESKDQMVADMEQTAEDLRRDLEVKGDEIDNLLENVRTLEVKLRLSNQKLRVTDQLLSEKEETFRKTEEKFQQDQRALEDRIASLSAIIAANNEAYQEMITNIKGSVNCVVNSSETMVWKFADDFKRYENCISRISHELQVAKSWVREMNKEKEQLKKDRRDLVELLQHKNEQELALKDMVEKLELKASKEELDKKHLTATVLQLKKTVGELENMMKEKNDSMVDLGEEKREAIRQLCLWIDYHRSRCDYLKDILSKTRRGQRAT